MAREPEARDERSRAHLVDEGSSSQGVDGSVCCHIVGIGASAGGLEALERFFANVPRHTGMAFVVLQHLSPDFESRMDELLARQTAIPIRRVEDGMAVEPDHIYLFPPRKDMIISGGRLILKDREPERGLTLPIDQFFRAGGDHRRRPPRSRRDLESGRLRALRPRRRGRARAGRARPHRARRRSARHAQPHPARL